MLCVLSLMCVLWGLLAGCGRVNRIALPQHGSVVQASPETVPSAPLYFTKAIFGLRRGEVVASLYNGELSGGDLCNYGEAGLVTWPTGLPALGRNTEELAGLFHEVMHSQGYDVTAAPSLVFDRAQEEMRAQFLVAARITDIKANICRHHGVWYGDDLHTSSGELYAEVEWSLYSRLEGRVVLVCRTSGYHGSEAAMPEGELVLFQEAFSEAVRALAARDDLRAALRSVPAAAAAGN